MSVSFHKSSQTNEFSTLVVSSKVDLGLSFLAGYAILYLLTTDFVPGGAMSTVVLPKHTIQALRDLTGEVQPDAALLLVLRDAFTYRLEQLQQQIQAFETKYGMSFTDYSVRWESEDYT